MYSVVSQLYSKPTKQKRANKGRKQDLSCPSRVIDYIRTKFNKDKGSSAGMFHFPTHCAHSFSCLQLHKCVRYVLHTLSYGKHNAVEHKVHKNCAIHPFVVLSFAIISAFQVASCYHLKKLAFEFSTCPYESYYGCLPAVA